MTFKAGLLSFSGVMTLHIQSSDDLEVLKAGDGQVRKGRLNHVLDKSAMSMRMMMPDGTVETANGDENGDHWPPRERRSVPRQRPGIPDRGCGTVAHARPRLQNPR